MRLRIGGFADTLLQFQPFKHGKLLALFRLAIGNGPRKPVHLPDIPGNDIRRPKIFRSRRLSVPSRTKVLFNGHQKIYARDEYIVALEFIAVRRLQRTICPFQPFALRKRILRHHAQLPV